MITIRQETKNDYDVIRELTIAAFRGSEFGHNGEADLVEVLRESEGHLSLVATLEKQVVGHMMFSPAVVRDSKQESRGMGLAPMAVHQTHQRKGIGSSLVKYGLDLIFSAGHNFVVVLGHPDFYSRFGFQIASETNVSHGFDGIPQEYFLICHNPTSNETSNVSGLAFYDSAFGPQHPNE